MNNHLHADPELEQMRSAIIEECEGIKNLLLRKNKNYGNSVFSEDGVFAQGATRLDNIAIRCEDKANRIKAMGGYVKVLQNTKNVEEDTIRDLIGYLLLGCAIHRVESEKRITLTPRGAPKC